MGKQHVGYARLRAGVDTILEDRRKRREERDKEKVRRTDSSVADPGDPVRFFDPGIRCLFEPWIRAGPFLTRGSGVFFTPKCEISFFTDLGSQIPGPRSPAHF
jgi:hypothetical protein